jgi:2-C-methyl-D-erythritol 4-phosphate cytidylyltransferase
MNVAVILAGGLSERTSEIGKPKQFVEVSGKPLITYSLTAFQECNDISAILIVTPDEWISQITDWVSRYGISKFKCFAKPGRTRQHSIYNALIVLEKDLSKNDVVVIHDAARPCVQVQDIENCVVSSKDYDGATPAIPVNDTIYQSKNGVVIDSLLNRDELYAGQTPECYNFGKYIAAHRALSDEDIANIRGSSEIAFKSEMNVRLYKGNPMNFKISNMGDFEYFKALTERER